MTPNCYASESVLVFVVISSVHEGSVACGVGWASRDTLFNELWHSTSSSKNYKAQLITIWLQKFLVLT